MSYYDDASLVFIPSGYKTSKAYSIKPTSGDGDLTFTRSNDTASRIGPDGLIEKVRTNQVLQSQTFDNAAWSKIGSTITANATAAPDGTTTADSNIESAALDEHGVSQVLAISAGLNTISVSVKANGRTRCRIGFANSSYGGMTAAQRFAYFDVSTGTVVQNISGGLSTIVSEGNGWYRCSVSQNLVAGDATGAIQLLFIDAGVNTFYTGNGTSGLFLWGAQLETGDIATDYIATTSAAVSVGPVANVPRLDYLNSSCPRLILEGQRTNLTAQSEDFNGWSTKVNVTTTANYAVSPDGYTNADRLQFTGGGFMYGTTGFNQTNGTTYTLSCYAKRNGSGTQSIGFFVDGSGGINSAWTLTSEWQRFTYTYTAGNTSTVGIGGASGADVSVYGFQFEVGAYATSYIPTLGAAVTRGADAASKTSASALIGQTEGTIFWEFEFSNSVAAGHECILNIDNGSFGNTIYIFKGATGSIVGEMYNGGVAQAAFSISSRPAGTYKVAIAYANNNTAFFVNGAQVGTTDTSCSVPATSRIQLGNGVLGPSTDLTKQLLLFPTRLSNADLAALTA